jgi:hypothetical protein
MLAEMFKIMALMAGWSAGTSGKSRRMSGASARAIDCIRPASRSTRMNPSQSAIMPMRPIAVSTANSAESIQAWFTSAIRPLKAAVAMAPRMRARKIALSIALPPGAREGPDCRAAASRISCPASRSSPQKSPIGISAGRRVPEGAVDAP